MRQVNNEQIINELGKTRESLFQLLDLTTLAIHVHISRAVVELDKAIEELKK